MLTIWDLAKTTSPNDTADAIGIDISSVLELFWLHEQQWWDLYDDFPNLVPPFRSQFLFGAYPTMSRCDGALKRTPLPKDTRIGLLMSSEKTPDGWIVRARPCRMNDQKLNWAEYYFGYRVTAEGLFRCFNDSMEERRKGLAYVGPEEMIRYAEANKHEIHYAYPFLLAVSLMHCRNVSLSRRQIPTALAKKRLRHELKPRFSYSVLEISPMRRVLTTEGGLMPGGSLVRALHICRGHFKDYRDGSGLFGRLKGVYWWDQSLRGAIAGGVHDKDYRINVGRVESAGSGGNEGAKGLSDS